MAPHEQRRRRSNFSIAITTLIVCIFTSLPTAEARTSTRVRVANIGHPVSTTIAGSLSVAIFGLGNGPRVNPTFYWTLYATWVLSAIIVISFTCFWITPAKRIDYFFSFLVIEVLCLAVLVASSAPALDEVSRRLQTLGPALTFLCACAPISAFDRYTPEAVIDVEQQGRASD